MTDKKSLNLVYLMEGTDLDALASAFGITLMEKGSKIVLPNGYSSSVRLALKNFEKEFEPITLKKSDIKDFAQENLKIDKLFITDSHDVEEAIENLTDLIDESTQIYIFDHHPIDEKDRFSKANYIIEKVGSATTIVVKKLIEKGIKLTPSQATILALGIYEDTGSFKYDITTPQDLRITAYLLEQGANLNEIKEILEKGISSNQLEIIKQLADNIQTLRLDGKNVIISTAYSRKYIPDISDKLGLIKPFQEVDAFFALITANGKTSIIARSKSKDIDVGEILSHFGGGGHHSAASAKVKGFTIWEIKNYLEALLFGTTFMKKKIEDVMYKGIKGFPLNTKLRDLKEYIKNFNFVPVVDKNEKFIGMASSKTISEALRLGQGNLTLNELTLEDVITFSPDMNVAEAERLMISSNQEYFPVLEKGKIVGFVSRWHLLKIIYGQHIISDEDSFISRERLKPRILRYEDKLRKHLPENLVNELKNIGKFAKELGYRVYLVGGIVRDIVMGRENLDIDIIVEGNAIKLVKEYAKEKNYKYGIYGEFLTAQLFLNDGTKIDFATARTELYSHPGAYPKVKRATLKEDLYRRDFTINTLAIELTDGDFGNLIDYFNALKDIREGMIRVLKQLSFIEDPIRIFRALRFAGRFNFKLGKTTEKLLKVAIDENILQHAPPKRVNQELNYIFNEQNVLEILALMNKYKVLEQIIPNFFNFKEREKLLNNLKHLLTTYEILFKYKPDRTLNYLLALLYHLPLDIAYKFLEKYQFYNKRRPFQLFYDVRNQFNQIPEKDSELYRLIKNIPKDLLIFISALNDKKDFPERVIGILQKLNNKSWLISGKDLIALGLKPSPLFSKIIENVLEKYLDNEIKNKVEALEYAKSILKQNYHI